jgi:hypothetical protein
LAIRIPNRYKDGVAAFARLNDGSFSELYEALRKAPSETPNEKELVAKIPGQVKTIDVEDIKKIVEFLASLYAYRSRTNVSAERLANDIYDAIQREDNHLVREQDASEFKTRLQKALVLDSLNLLTAKAKELQTDVERAFCDARILTDLRPIFGSEVDTPKAMVIVHTLKLAYHDAATGKHEELFVAIDSEDIEKLKAILERAERKTKSLMSRLQAAGIKTVDLS